MVISKNDFQGESFQVLIHRFLVIVMMELMKHHVAVVSRKILFDSR